MAEAFLNRIGKKYFIAESAGLEAGVLNPLAVAVMLEIGYDISKNKSKSVFDFHSMGKTYDIVIKVCDQRNAKACPIFPNVKKTLNWDLEDPSSASGNLEQKLNKTRQIRDQILILVNNLVTEYSTNNKVGVL
jgi:arsenate reductase